MQIPNDKAAGGARGVRLFFTRLVLVVGPASLCFLAVLPIVAQLQLNVYSVVIGLICLAVLGWVYYVDVFDLRSSEQRRRAALDLGFQQAVATAAKHVRQSGDCWIRLKHAEQAQDAVYSLFCPTNDEDNDEELGSLFATERRRGREKGSFRVELREHVIRDAKTSVRLHGGAMAQEPDCILKIWQRPASHEKKQDDMVWTIGGTRRCMANATTCSGTRCSNRRFVIKEGFIHPMTGAAYWTEEEQESRRGLKVLTFGKFRFDSQNPHSKVFEGEFLSSEGDRGRYEKFVAFLSGESDDTQSLPPKEHGTQESVASNPIIAVGVPLIL